MQTDRKQFKTTLEELNLPAHAVHIEPNAQHYQRLYIDDLSLHP